MQNERVRKVDQKYITLTRLIFTEINFCEINLHEDLFSQMPKSIFLRGFISVDGQILLILCGLIFTVDKNLYLKKIVFSDLRLNTKN